MDPAQALNLVSAGFRTAASVGKFMDARNQRKHNEARRAAAPPGTRPLARPVAVPGTSAQTVTYVAAPESAVPIPTPEELAEIADNTRRDIFIVLGILGEKLLGLGVVNDPWLPFAREEALKAFRMKGPLLATMFETEMEEVMQYAVTAALFLCTGCWPMHIYRGFGACVLNDWLWGCPDPQYAGRSEQGECAIVDACLALLKTATQGHEVLKGYPAGLNRMAPNYGKLSSEEARWYHDAKVGQMKKRGMPLAMDGTFSVSEVIWPWSHYNSGFAVQNAFSYEWGKMVTPLSWEQDPGRMIYAFTIGGFLELQPGQMIEPVNEITTSILWWLYGLNGTTFKLIMQGQLSVYHWKLKPKYQLKWNEGLGRAVYAIRDEQRVQMRNAVRMSLPPGMAMPSGPPAMPQPIPQQTQQPSPQQQQVQTPVSPTSSIPGYPPAFTPASGASPWEPPHPTSVPGPSPGTTASSPAQNIASPGAAVSQVGGTIYSHPAAVQSAPAVAEPVPGQHFHPQGYHHVPQQTFQQYPPTSVHSPVAPIHTGSWPAQTPQVQRTASMPVGGHVSGHSMSQPGYGTPQQQPMSAQPGYHYPPAQGQTVTTAPQQYFHQPQTPGYFPQQPIQQQTPDLALAFNTLSITSPSQQYPSHSGPAPAQHFPPSQTTLTNPAPTSSTTSPPAIAAPQPIAPVTQSATWNDEASAWTGPAQTPSLEVAPPPAYSIKKVEVQYDFVGRTQGEMSVKKGDALEVIRAAAGDGWLIVRKGGEEGRVPEAYVKDF